MAGIKVVPAINTANCDLWCEQMNVLLARGGATHWDIAYDQFVPHQTVGIDWLLETYKDKLQDMQVSAHCMVEKPLDIIKTLAEIGVMKVVVHQQKNNNETQKLVAAIRHYNMIPALTAMPKEKLLVVTGVQQYHIMGVNPGASGQEILPDTAVRVKDVKNSAGAKSIIAVDGGVTAENASTLVKAGADVLVVGNAFWQSAKPDKLIKEIESII